MIEYYTQLFEAADSKKSKIETHLKKIQGINLNQSAGRSSSTDNSISSNDSFHTVFEEPQKADRHSSMLEEVTEIQSTESSEKKLHSSKSLDVLNANSFEEQSDNNANIETVNRRNQQETENSQSAEQINENVMQNKTEKNIGEISHFTYFTEAQKNKLKVLSSEFGITVNPEKIHTTNYETSLSQNRNRVMGISDCFEYDQKLDNERFLRKNLKNMKDTSTIKQSKSLTLDFQKININAQHTFDKPLPMSVDSTPMSDLPLSIVTTPSTMFLSLESGILESVPTTAETQQTEEGFFSPKYDASKETVPLYYRKKLPDKRFSKRVAKEEASAISSNCLKLFLYESVQIPLATQNETVNNGILKYFMHDLNYMSHIGNLRDYFFLQDGEFGRIITNNLFTKLYDANSPSELINCKTLQNLVFSALDISIKNHSRSNTLSFEIINFPKTFDLSNPDVLDCLSLTYKIEWPLNILLPVNTIGKYDEVFKFLLKLSRMSWVLKKIFLVSTDLQVGKL